MRRVAPSFSVLVSILLLAACSSAPAGATTAIRTLAGQPMTPCVVQGEVPVKAEVAGQCGTLPVPEDRSDPHGRTIGLRVAVVPALAAAPAPHPFFAIAGGPGYASTQFFAWLPGLYARVHATHDIVVAMGKLDYDNKRFESARAMFTKAAADGVDDPEPQRYLGLLEQRGGQ
jgi:hypothetical protein